MKRNEINMRTADWPYGLLSVDVSSLTSILVNSWRTELQICAKLVESLWIGKFTSGQKDQSRSVWLSSLGDKAEEKFFNGKIVFFFSLRG